MKGFGKGPRLPNGEPLSKKPKTGPIMTIQALRARIANAINGDLKSANFKCELNTVLMLLFKRPLTKADLVIDHKRGPPDVLSLGLPVLQFCAEQTFHSRLTEIEKKPAEQTLAGEALKELMQRIDNGELDIPEEPLPSAESFGSDAAAGPVATGPLNIGRQNREDDYKSALNTALQKVFGRSIIKGDMIFSHNPATNSASIQLPAFDPPLTIESQLEVEGTRNLSHEQNRAMKSNVEHQLAHLALQELEQGGVLIKDHSKVLVQSWTPGPEAAKIKEVEQKKRPPEQQGGLQSHLPPTTKAASLAGSVQEEVREPKVVPGRHLNGPAVVSPPAAVVGDQKVLLRLRRLQESWAKTSSFEEYSESLICKRDGEDGALQWHAVLTLQTGDTFAQGEGFGPRQLEAKEKAAEELLIQVDEPPEPEPIAPVKGVGKRPMTPSPKVKGYGGKGSTQFRPQPPFKGSGKGGTQYYRPPGKGKY
eukprot:TRINITY_DN39659_c0_g1_i1.p1 TRINITY_DN39659_c0_g1~~TRINITY_DN39659_c0_g1_i1.p1  ORF type:complete len:478 (+),score=85.92 TRINITY_DN39659_c0_g1_i1:152-1585(+)